MNACSKLTSRNVFPLRRSSERVGECQNGARRQGFASPRHSARPCRLRAVPARDSRDERLRREHFTVYLPVTKIAELDIHNSPVVRPRKWRFRIAGRLQRPARQ